MATANGGRFLLNFGGIFYTPLNPQADVLDFVLEE